uniref:Uncharacterized protein n=1 Tax=Anguilla anguilla TaxID=7936 RepID=A0A0E9SJP1_ANGAN
MKQTKKTKCLLCASTCHRQILLALFHSSS